MDELWKPVPGISPTKYEVSNFGRVRRHYKNGPRIKYQSTGPEGYKRVVLYNAGKKFWARVHRLVLQAFVGPCPEDFECCHNNGERDDNRLDNLRWDTRSNNVIDSILHGTHPATKLTPDKVRGIRSLLIAGTPPKEIAQKFSISISMISYIKSGRNWGWLA